MTVKTSQILYIEVTSLVSSIHRNLSLYFCGTIIHYYTAWVTVKQIFCIAKQVKEILYLIALKEYVSIKSLFFDTSLPMERTITGTYY